MTDNTNTHSALLPCPFCSNSDIGIGKLDCGIPVVYCTSFDCASIESSSEQVAITAWNTRPGHAALVDALKEFRKIFDCDVLNLSPAALSLYKMKAETALKQAGVL